MQVRMGSYVRAVAVLGALLVGCGTDAKPEGASHDPPPSVGETGSLRDLDTKPDAAVEPAPMTRLTCPEDDLTTPGVECEQMVACGGTPEKPTLCDMRTRSCCMDGIPTQDTVHCVEGLDACGKDQYTTPCDGAEDCGDGEVCCFLLSQNFKSACVAAADCNGTSMIYCHTTEECPEGLECKSAPHAPWQAGCQ